MKRLTMRSSSEWKLMTQSRPPCFRTSSACCSTVSSCCSSALIAMRIAWNVFVAGWIFSPRAGRASSTIRASCAVREMGASSRADTIARAMRCACLSSPYCFNTRFNSCSSTFASQVLAGTPESGSIRISRGPSRRKLKPRSASSSCGDETPRSKRSPSTRPTRSRSPMNVSSCAKSPLISSKRGSAVSISGAAAMACGSRSMAMRRPLSPSCCRISLLCPPRPNVPST